MDTSETLIIDGTSHDIGNKECAECWMGYPKPCPKCGGLVHAEFGDENSDGDYWLYYVCDKCKSMNKV